jgi:hypothetical protein
MLLSESLRLLVPHDADSQFIDVLQGEWESTKELLQSLVKSEEEFQGTKKAPTLRVSLICCCTLWLRLHLPSSP